MYVSTRLRPSRTDSATSYNALRTFSIIHCESKKLDPFSFEHNFRKYCPILIILSLLQTEIISPQRYDWISHFTYSLLVHYLEKSTAYTFSQKLFNKPAVHAVISLLLQSRKFWWYLLLTSLMLLHDVIMTSYCGQRYAECLITTLCSSRTRGDWAGLQPVQAPPRCTKCNSHINDHSTSVRTSYYSM